jgi:hypothetical protein
MLMELLVPQNDDAMLPASPHNRHISNHQQHEQFTSVATTLSMLALHV